VQAGQHGGYLASVDFAPDSLTNNELGWKTLWMDGRLQWNGAVYQEDWNQTQSAVFGLGIVNLGVILNGGDYRVRGVETSGTARVATGFTIEAGAAWNQSALVRQATLLWRDGTPIDFSSLQDSKGNAFPNPSGAPGSPLAGAPPFQGNIRARYEFAFDVYEAFAQIGAGHQSHSLSTTFNLGRDLQGKPTAYDLPSFTTYDAALGLGKGGWRVQLYAENLADTRAQLYANYTQLYKAVTVNRPCTIGLHFSFAFDDR